MYDMYPDSWGPAKHAHHRDDTHGAHGAHGAHGDGAVQAVQRGLDLRDNGGERPDDN